jgi:uncharacterized protein YutE (UPF0331/DUF86 family)
MNDKEKYKKQIEKLIENGKKFRSQTITKQPFIDAGLDFDLIISRLIQKGYVTRDYRVSMGFKELDDEFKSWFPNLTEGFRGQLAEIERILHEARGRQMVRLDLMADCEYWFSQIITFIQKITALDRYFYDEATKIINGSKRQGGIFCQNIEMMIGFLKHLYDAIDNDLLIKMENELTAADFNKFMEHATYYYDQKRKMESSIIASAIFEDSIKKVATKNGIQDLSKLDSVISALQTQGIVTPTEAKKLRYYAGVRNSALHASWDEFALDDVKDLISGTSKLIENYLMS